MSTTTTNEHRYNRKYSISAVGDIVDQATSLRSSELGSLLTSESHMRVTTEGLTAGTTIDVKVKLRNSSSFTVLATLTGSETKIIDITTWDIVHFEVTAYDAQPGNLIVTAFVKNPPPVSIADVGIIDSDGDELDVQPDGSINVNVSSCETATIYNVTITGPDVGVEKSQAFTNGSRKILIRHRDGGRLEFAFTPSFTSFITIPKGASYSEEGLNLQSKTIYFKASKVGVVEILEWS
jgi:hypothetical protein